VYHGTDAQSAESIERVGLDEVAWNEAAGAGGPDGKGFSVTVDLATAEAWARIRAAERGAPSGVILAADAGNLPLRQGAPGEWTDLGEWFIAVEDFPQVGPGTFRPAAEVPAFPGAS